MEKKSQLQKVQLKLTIIFTLLVFWIASVLQVSFFSYKYLSWIQSESRKIEFLAQNIADKNIPLNQLQKIIKDERQLWDIKNKWLINGVQAGKWRIMNFAILDSDWHVLLQNIRWEINIEAVLDVVNNKNKEVIIDDGTIVKYLPIPRSLETYQLLLFKLLNYDLEEYIWDILRFFLAITWFSIFFFFIWYLFVRKNLKPVEKNIIEMNDFVHNAGHELKTPIAVIDSNLQLMKQFWEYREDMIDENISEINRLNNLIEALVTIADIQEKQDLQDNNIDREVEYVLEELNHMIHEKNIQIKYIQKQDFIISSDREYLYIVLSNIIKNAIKFSDQWGTVHISYRDRVCVIQDFGCGIEEENIWNIFWRFFQEKEARSGEWFGIWLALVSKISQIYDWEIKVESEKGQGTKFIINF